MRGQKKRNWAWHAGVCRKNEEQVEREIGEIRGNQKYSQKGPA